MILQWLASPEWANVVKALLHTLWQGAVAVVILGLALRHLRHPVARYRCSLAALAGIMFAGLITWAILNRPVAAPVPATVTAAPISSASLPVRPMLKSDAPVVVVNSPPPTPIAPQFDWTAWLALLWLTGAGAMLVRAGCQVAGAEHLRRSARPLEDARLAGLLAETRRAVRLARRVRMAVTDQLTSPAVVGVLVPTLILPLSLLTSLSPEQLRFVLLHELAHIRRGDYFANLFQLFAEALLFFNPAVWWISRQIRIEREACCDALAIELSGAPADYAQTLVHVAERVLQPAPAAAPALGNRREPSSLADRIQRLLVPGYRPRLRLTWRAMITALLVGGALLFVSALGTRVTIAAILPPQERIERIEKKMAEYGVNPAAANFNIYDQHAPQVKIAGHIRMADGSRVPQWLWLNVNSSVGGNSTGTSFIARYGAFSNSIRAGTIYLGAQTENSAPTVLGPLDGTVTNAFENLDIVLGPGFDVPLQLVDADSGKALPAGELATMFWMNNNGLPARSWKSGPDGSVLLTRCADLPLDVTVNVPGYEIIKQRFDHLHAGETLRLPLRHGEILSGRVLDQTTGRPVAGAEFHLLYQSGGENAGHFEWDDALHRLGQNDTEGDFTLNQLRRGWSYYLGVSAPGHESVILQKVSAGSSNLVVRLGPELIVRGRVIGDLGRLQRINGEPAFSLGTTEVFEQTSDGYSQWVPLHLANGVATFQFTNRTPGPVTLSGGNYSENREVSAPIDDWVVNLDAAAKTAVINPPKREVIFRFKYPAGAPPVGTVEITIPDNLETNHLTAHDQEMEITNGEVETQIAIGGRTQIQPKHMVGYWFNQWTVGGNGFITVTNGPGPLVLDIPLIPAGAIYARARNADGTPADQILFGLSELKRAPTISDPNLQISFNPLSETPSSKWVSSPLPLGGTYQVYAWRGNSFCVSQPIKLTETDPDTEAELQFPPGQTFHGVLLGPDGKPLADTQLTETFVLSGNHSFGLQPMLTDDQGRFELDDATPTTGRYQVEASVPGLMAENTKLDFRSQPQTIRLPRGHVLGGRLVEAGTGYAIPNAEVRAWVMDDSLPAPTAHTDADGRFEFTTLADADYTLFANDGQMASDRKYPADGNTNLTVAIKLYAWSSAKPKPPETATNRTATTGPLHSTNFQAALDALKKRTGVDHLGEPIITITGGRGVNQAHIFPDPPAVAIPASTNAAIESDSGQTVVDRVNIMAKLDRMRIPHVSFERLRLDEVVRQLNQMAIDFDPDKIGVPISIAPNSATNSDDDINSAVIQIPSLTDVRLADVLDAVVLVADKPLKYSITDHGVVFSAEGPERPQLFMRTFRVYPSTFSSGMKDALAGGGLPYTALPNSNSTPSQVARAFFTILGVNLNEPPGKSVFYNERLGVLFVKATATDLDTIERALDVLIQVAPQIHLKARFIAVPEDSFDFGRFKISTNVADGQIAGILTESEMKTVVKTLASTDKVINLSDPEITVISGRQTQMNAFAVITTTATNLEIGPTLDVVPYVLADNYTINLALIPSFRDIERYDRITNNLGQVVNLSDVSPRFQIQPRVAAVNIWDGQTVVLGGFEERDLKGNILTAPARKLLVFVTASLVDPAGNRIHSEDQLPFAQEAVPPQPTTLQAQPRGVPGWDFPDPPRKPAWPDPQLLPAQEFKVPALRNLH